MTEQYRAIETDLESSQLGLLLVETAVLTQISFLQPQKSFHLTAWKGQGTQMSALCCIRRRSMQLSWGPHGHCSCCAATPLIVLVLLPPAGAGHRAGCHVYMLPGTNSMGLGTRGALQEQRRLRSGQNHLHLREQKCERR